MPIIDSQVHAYAADTPENPWKMKRNWPPSVTGDEMVRAMDEVGVDGAILVSAFSIYGYDATFAVAARNDHPDKFGLVKPIDLTNPGLAEDIDDWKATPGTVGIRLLPYYGDGVDVGSPAVKAALDAARRHDFPTNLLLWGALDAGIEMIDRFPDNRFVIDHLGLEQPRTPPAPDAPWTDLPRILDLATRPNVVIKISGACTLSKTGYPYDDIWDPLARIFDAWGIDRCLWGTDWTRTHEILSYEQGVEPFRLTDRLSESDRAMLMGGASAKTYDWSPSPS